MTTRAFVTSSLNLNAVPADVTFMAISTDGSSSAPAPTSSPTGMQTRAPRARLVHAVMCRFAEEETFHQVTTLNISQSGMLIEGSIAPAVGSTVEFKFFLETGFEILSGSGTVARHGANPAGGNPCTGIAFGALDPAKQRILARVVELNSES